MKDKNLNENLEDEETTEGATIDEEVEVESEDLLEQLSKKENECNEYLDMLKRTKAEYDNFRKRTLKEKEELFSDGFRGAIEKIIPVLDNLERALEHSEEEGSLKEGLDMILKMFKDLLQKEGVVEIPSLGENFDPNLHNAVMHVEDDSFGDNEVIEVLLRGYTYKDKVIRHSMVKVAN